MVATYIGSPGFAHFSEQQAHCRAVYAKKRSKHLHGHGFILLFELPWWDDQNEEGFAMCVGFLASLARNLFQIFSIRKALHKEIEPTKSLDLTHTSETSFLPSIQ